jgi:RAB protein geranylgeranyltransferase component A
MRRTKNLRRRLNFDELNIPMYEVEMFIRNYIYSKRNRQIVKEKWFDNTTYEKLAEKYNLSSRQIMTIVGRAEDQLCRYFHLKE